MAKPTNQQSPAYNQSVRQTLIASAIIVCLVAPQTYANPTGGVVVNGSASFTASSHTLTINNSPNAIIDWHSFSINKGELTQFIQQSAASQVLNRVTGGDPSQILGNLQSNGRVFLINPNGIVFGAGAQVDVAGLVVSTLNLSHENFIAGKLKFDAQMGAGDITNQGNIHAANGGQVIIVAPNIENSGIINSANGDIILAAGKSVNLIDLDHPEISVEINASANQAINLGQLVAKNISIYGNIIDNSGAIDANTAVVGQNGKIILDAQENLSSASTSTMTADGGPSGGTIILNAGVVTRIDGVVEAIGTQTSVSDASVAGKNQPVIGQGGTIAVLGKQIALLDKAKLNASGTQGGGVILVGGDEHGQITPLLLDLTNQLTRYAGAQSVMPTLVNNQISNNNKLNQAFLPLSEKSASSPIADSVLVSRGASIRVDAEQKGDGGKIIVWADNTAVIDGQISAKGGANSGNGGFVETSGKQFLNISSVPDLFAPNGKGGDWLLDPNNITIQTTGPDTNVAGITDFTTTNDSSIITTASIEAALNAGTHITISTGSSGSNNQAGNITVNNPLAKTEGADASLTLSAYNNININADIGSSNGKLNLSLNADSNATTAGSSYIATGVTVALNGGALSFAHGLHLSGAIANSTVLSSDATVLSSSNGVLAGVTLGDAGNHTLTSSGALTIKNNLSLYNGLSYNIGNGDLIFAGPNAGGSSTQSLMAVGSQLHPVAVLQMADGHIQTNDSKTLAEKLILGPGLTMMGYGWIDDRASGQTIVNNATLIGYPGEADASKSLTIAPYFFTNDTSGVIQVNGGTLTLAAGNWSNAGIIVLQQGTLNFGGVFDIAGFGAFSRFADTQVNLVGTLDNSNHTLDIGAAGMFGSGPFGLGAPGLSSLSGVIKNGTVISSDATILKSDNGLLDGVTLGDATHHNPTSSGTLNFSNSVQSGVINVSADSTLNFSGNNSFNNVSLTGKGYVNFGSGINNGTGILSNVEDTVSVTGNAIFNLPVANRQNWNFVAGTADFTSGLTQNAGLTRLVGGDMQGNYNLKDGALGGSGSISGNVNITAGKLSPGFSPGSITIVGDLTLGQDSQFIVQVGGLVQGVGYDYLNVQGSATLAGSLNVQSYAAYVPTAGTSYNFMHFTSSNGDFSTVNLPWDSMKYLVLSDGLTLSMPGIPIESSPVIEASTQVMARTVPSASMQSILQGGLQNPLIVANAPSLAGSVPFTSQPIFFDRKPSVGLDVCK